MVWFYGRFVLICVLISCLTVLGFEKRRRTRRMVNGTPAKLADWPFSVWLVKNVPNYPDYCGGALIRDRWVLTAAHCIDRIGDKPELLSVRIGSTKTHMLKNIKKFSYSVSKIIPHPDYKTEGIVNDDLALIRLKHPVAMNRYNFIRPIRLGLWRFKNSHRYTSTCRTAGWGRFESFTSIQEMNNSKKAYPENLMSIDVPILGKKNCLSKFDTKNGSLLENGESFWQKMMCGGSRNPVVGTPCLYDSGSALVCEDAKGNKELHGIVIAIHGPYIRTKPCTPGLQISIFVRVAHYASWIIKTMKKFDD